MREWSKSGTMKSRPRFPLNGLTPELFLVVVLPLSALLLVVTFGGVALHQRGMREMVGERDERAAQASAMTLSEQLYNRLQAVQGLVAAGSGPAPDNRLDQDLKAYGFLQADFEAGLAFYGPGGKRLASTGQAGVWETLEREQDPEIGWMLAGTAQDPGGQAQGEIAARLSQVYQLKDAPLMYAAAHNPATGLTAVGAFSPARMAENALMHIMLPGHGGGEVFLVDSRKQVIYQSGAMLEPAGLEAHPGVIEALNGQSGSIFMGSSQEHVAAYSPVTLAGWASPWALVTEEPWESVSSPLLRLTEYAPLVLLPVVIISLLAMWFGTHRIVEPLRALQARAARFGWGDYTAVDEPVGGINEIRQLQIELAHLAHKVQASQQGLRDYIGAMTAGQEDERRRLARELHDDTLQALIALNQRAQLLQLRLNGSFGQTAGNALVQEVNGLQTLADDTIQNLRRLTRALRPIYLEDLGLATALEMLAKEMSQPGLAIAFESTGKVQRLAPAVELALYRLAQEALSNVIRHAQASRAQLKIEYNETEVHLQVSDNGRGFDLPGSPAAFAPGGHFGLLGMHERAEMIGARLSLQSQPGEGTQVRVVLPAKNLG